VKVSATLRRDPTMTKRLVKAYENDLVTILKGAKDDLRFALTAFKGLEAEPAKVDFTSINTKIRFVLTDKVLAPASSKAKQQLVKVQAAAKLRAEQLLKTVGITAGTGFNPAEKAIGEALIERNIGSLKGLTDDMGKEITKELTDGIARGEGISKLAKRIDSVSDMGIERARVIARTETLYAYNTTAKNTFRKNGIESVEWLAAYEDGRRCDQCADLNGEKFALGSEPDCPLHPQCRCTLLPVIEEAA